ncbi:unnamed protein product [Discosporangium mesarthrocarpum]
MGQGQGPNGWEALGTAVATSCSEDRIFLCVSPMRPLLLRTGDRGPEGGGVHLGLRHAEILELLCVMLVSLAQEGGLSDPGSFVARTCRLQHDLKVCIQSSEGWELRCRRQGRAPSRLFPLHPRRTWEGHTASYPQVCLTAEQQLVVGTDISPESGGLMEVLTFAGTGKTMCLREYARGWSDKRILYLAFNKRVVAEAGGTFPKNVDCSTMHSLAWKRCEVKHKIRKNLRTAISHFLKVGR